jgi:hypothetical protein
MTRFKKQHQLAVSLSKELEVDYLRLELQRDSHYQYHGWTLPLISGNGSPGISKRGGNSGPRR